MKIGQRTSSRMGCEISAKPLFLTRTSLAPSYFSALAVQDHDVPLPKLETVKAILGITCCRAEIFKVKCSASGMKFMVTYSRSGSRLETAPRPVVANEILFRSIWISEITDGHDRAGNLFDQFRCRFRSSETRTVGDVSRPHQNGRFVFGRRRGVGNCTF